MLRAGRGQTPGGAATELLVAILTWRLFLQNQKAATDTSQGLQVGTSYLSYLMPLRTPRSPNPRGTPQHATFCRTSTFQLTETTLMSKAQLHNYPSQKLRSAGDIQRHYSPLSRTRGWREGEKNQRKSTSFTTFPQTRHGMN